MTTTTTIIHASFVSSPWRPTPLELASLVAIASMKSAGMAGAIAIAAAAAAAVAVRQISGGMRPASAPCAILLPRRFARFLST